MITEDYERRDWIDEVLEIVFGDGQLTQTHTVSQHNEVDVDQLLELDISKKEIEQALEYAGGQADSLGDDLEEANSEYNDLLDDIEEAETEAEVKKLKREASKLKNRGNRLDRQHTRWIRREQSLDDVNQRLEELIDEGTWQEEHGQVFEALDDFGVEDLVDRIEEECAGDTDVVAEIESREEAEEIADGSPFEEVERDLAERSWGEVETEGSDQFGTDLLEDELRAEEVEIGQDQGGMVDD